MKRIFMVCVILLAWFCAVSAQAEILVEKTGGGYEIYEITKVKKAALPEVPGGIILDEKEVAAVYMGQLVKKALGKEVVLKRFFPLPDIRDVTLVTGIRWENNGWTVKDLSIRKFGQGSIFLSVILGTLTVMMLIIGIRDRIDVRKRKTIKLFSFYAGSLAAAYFIITGMNLASTSYPFILGEIIIAFIVICCILCYFLLPSFFNLTGLLVVINASIMLGSFRNSFVINQYFIFLTGLMALSFLWGEGIYRYRRWKLKRLVSQMSVNKKK